LRRGSGRLLRLRLALLNLLRLFADVLAAAEAALRFDIRREGGGQHTDQEPYK
jgi:hypothetical protein